jgi:uncharacterized membrane-anchored protein
MNKTILIILAISFITFSGKTQELDSTQLLLNEIEESLDYQIGSIELKSGNATLNVPEGFYYLNKKQSIYVLTDLWGNPKDTTILGMLVPIDMGIFDKNSFVFIINFSKMGYVEDSDADNIDYDDLLNEMKEETGAESAERIKLGLEPIRLIGWASKPFYDKELKTLHWAKEIQFGGVESNTLNYNLRILGRNGVMILNAVAQTDALPRVKKNIRKIINCIQYKEGSKYSDFNPEVDNVAAWTIGGLVAGKVLAKTGFFIVLLKFWKLIAFGLLAACGTIWKYLTGQR